MKYTVEVQGESIEVDVRDGVSGLEVSVGGEPHVAARLEPAPAPLHTLVQAGTRRRVVVAADPHEAGAYSVALEGKRPVRVSAIDALTKATAAARGPGAGSGQKTLRAAMPGVVVEFRVEPGQTVGKGDVLLILEAMKMQNEIAAQGPAVVKELCVPAGEAVAAGAKLIEFAPVEA